VGFWYGAVGYCNVMSSVVRFGILVWHDRVLYCNVWSGLGLRSGWELYCREWFDMVGHGLEFWLCWVEFCRVLSCLVWFGITVRLGVEKCSTVGRSNVMFGLGLWYGLFL
jgi:hypothetical protein